MYHTWCSFYGWSVGGNGHSSAVQKKLQWGDLRGGGWGIVVCPFLAFKLD